MVAHLHFPPTPADSLCVPSCLLVVTTQPDWTQPDWTQLDLTGPNNPIQRPDDPTGLDRTQPDQTRRPDMTRSNDPARPDEHGTVNLSKDEKSEWETVVQNNLFPYPCWVRMIPGEPVECKKAKESVWEKVSIALPVIIVIVALARAQ
jgi:hypothetical protein